MFYEVTKLDFIQRKGLLDLTHCVNAAFDGNNTLMSQKKIKYDKKCCKGIKRAWI